MELHKRYIVLGLIIAFALFFGIVARAGETNSQVKIMTGTDTPNRSAIELPGYVNGAVR